MKTTSAAAESLRRVLVQSAGGVVGLVDDLLALCREHGLQLDWHSNRFRLRSSTGDWEELVDVQLRKSAFRAVLARIAALCNEQTPNSVSPYGGQGELSGKPRIRVAFVNTPSEQTLELVTEGGAACSG